MTELLGNSRLTFTTKHEQETYTASMELNTQSDESQRFDNYNSYVNDLLDHTDAGATFDRVLILNGGYNGQVGLAKSFAVVPGDVVSAKVYAKYTLPTTPGSNLMNFAAALTQAFSLSPGLTGEAGAAFDAIDEYGAFIANGARTDNDNWPKGFLNILVFDKDYKLVDFAYQQLSSDYVQDGPTKAPHGELFRELQIRHAGYVYIYLSNEGGNEQQIGFDDLEITHDKSDVIQQDEYYPFGLTFNGYQGENSVENKFKFQEQEHIDALDLGWDAFKWRNHQPEIGRFFGVDPLTEKYFYNSPYAFSENRVIDGRELEGLEYAPVNPGGSTAGAMAIAKAVTGRDMTNGEGILKIQEGEIAGLKAAAPHVAKIAITASMAPELAIPFGISVITGYPVTPSPQAMATTSTQVAQTIEQSTEAQFADEVVALSKSMKTQGNYPAAVVGAELPNGSRAIAPSGDIPIQIAPTLENAANTVGGVGTVRAGNTVGCCAEFRAANQLLLDNSTFAPDAVKFTPAIRPRTGQVIPPCENCKDIFKQLQ